jgi:hypothetical protein
MMADTMLRTQVRTKASYTSIIGTADVIASIRVAGHILLIHRLNGGFTATYAPVGLNIGQSATISDVISQIESRANCVEEAIKTALGQMRILHAPLFSAEEGIQTRSWQWRERKRFEDGEYRPVPVIGGREYPKEHWVHFSTVKTDTDFVSYTPSEAYGLADRQVRLKFGRYLRKAFPDMTDADIQKAVTEMRAKLALEDTPITLLFTTEREKINEIFETAMFARDSNCTSCMYDKFAGDGIRPYHVYADSPDVAVASLVEHGNIIARSVVSTKDKTWVRCYSVEQGPTQCQMLADMLTDAGYRAGSLVGNRLTKLNTRDVMLPYIDYGGMQVIDTGRGFWQVVEAGGDYTADQTDGTATSNESRCETCDNFESDCICTYCECCEESYDGGCDTCIMCEDCDGCIAHDRCTCERCSRCNEIIEPTGRYVTRCDCARCDECGELENDCTCDTDAVSEDVEVTA